MKLYFILNSIDGYFKCSSWRKPFPVPTIKRRLTDLDNQFRCFTRLDDYLKASMMKTILDANGRRFFGILTLMFLKLVANLTYVLGTKDLGDTVRRLKPKPQRRFTES